MKYMCYRRRFCSLTRDLLFARPPPPSPSTTSGRHREREPPLGVFSLWFRGNPILYTSGDIMYLRTGLTTIEHLHSCLIRGNQLYHWGGMISILIKKCWIMISSYGYLKIFCLFPCFMTVRLSLTWQGIPYPPSLWTVVVWLSVC